MNALQVFFLLRCALIIYAMVASTTTTPTTVEPSLSPTFSGQTYAPSTRAPVFVLPATGFSIQMQSTFTLYSFNAVGSYNFTVLEAVYVDFLVVGGGGGGSWNSPNAGSTYTYYYFKFELKRWRRRCWWSRFCFCCAAFCWFLQYLRWRRRIRLNRFPKQR